MTHNRIAILLAISVALNLFLLGVVTSWVWHGQHGPPPHERRATAAAHRGWRPDESAWLSQAEREELRPRRKALRALRRDAEALLRAETFEPEKFRAALSALRTETDAIQAALHELIAKKAAGASVEERRRMADASWPSEPRRRTHPRAHPR